MHTNWLQTSRSLFFSIVLHIVLGGILIFSFKFSNKPTPIHKPTTNIVNQEERKSGLLKRQSSIISSTSNNYLDDDMQSISTVSGSGINFFRNVVRKHGRRFK